MRDRTWFYECHRDDDGGYLCVLGGRVGVYWGDYPDKSKVWTVALGWLSISWDRY